jgi:methionyl aminopeptidase
MKTQNAISIKTKEEIDILREGGKILAEIMAQLKSSLKIGISTKNVDEQAESLMHARRVIPAFKGYRGYPASICISLNHEIVHGIPGQRIIKDGDVVSLDIGIIHKEYYVDSAVTVCIGSIREEIKRLLDVTHESLYAGIAQARPGNHLSDISHAIQVFVEAQKFSVVREFVGHGIGRRLHEDPEIPNFGPPHQGPVLKEGMVFAIEPMVNLGGWQTKVLGDGWTVVTADGKPSAHFEHTIVITKNDPEILTQ